jgi:hypothetical protein
MPESDDAERAAAIEKPTRVDARDLPEDAHHDWVHANGPDGRSSYVKEVTKAIILRREDGEKDELSPGDFLLWQDGHYSGLKRDKFLSNNEGWDLFNEGEDSRGQSSLERMADAPESGTDDDGTTD